MKNKTKPSCSPPLIILSLLALTIVSCNDRKSENASSMTESELIEAANRLDSMFLIAFNQGDVDAFMNLYWNSPELSAYPPARVMQLKGFDAVRDFYIKDFGSNKGAKLEYVSNTNTPFKDVVVGHGTFRWTMPIEGAAPIVLEARHTVVKALKDGKLVIVVDHTSAPMRAEAPDDSRESK